jgi:hypothetical protein
MRETGSKFHAEDPQILGVTVQNIVAHAIFESVIWIIVG